MKKLLFFLIFVVMATTVWATCPTGLSGTGTLADPCLVSSCNQLQNATQQLGANYSLTTNIDCSGTASWNGGLGFLPIGNCVGISCVDVDENYFTGAFEGNNYTISHLYMKNTTGIGMGLFGAIQGSTIQNLGLENVSIEGSTEIGGLVGVSEGSSGAIIISNVYVKGVVNVVGASGGGLIGVNMGGETISNCYTNVTLTCTADCGGLVGNFGGGTITNCYTTGDIFGTGDGGIIGTMNDGTITNCFSVGNNTDGALVGSKMGGTITNSYWNNHTGNADNCYPSASVGCTAIGDNEDYFKGDVYPASEPMASWGFYGIWEENLTTYPVLTWENKGGNFDLTPPTFTTIPANVSIERPSSLSVTFVATDGDGISLYLINDTTRFNISQGGVLINITDIPDGVYSINVSANDTSNNVVSTIFLATWTTRQTNELEDTINPELRNAAFDILGFFPLIIIIVIAGGILGLWFMFQGGTDNIDLSWLQSLPLLILVGGFALVIFFIILHQLGLI